MFQNILRSISGSLSEFAKWEPTADRSEAALRGGLEKSVLFLLCSSAIMGVAALMLVSLSPFASVHRFELEPLCLGHNPTNLVLRPRLGILEWLIGRYDDVWKHFPRLSDLLIDPAILLTLAAACSAALFFDTQSVKCEQLKSFLEKFTYLLLSDVQADLDKLRIKLF